MSESIGVNRFISDLHLGHDNIIRFDNRPYRNAKEMDKDLIKRWNEVTKDEDTVYILGDFSWHAEAETVKILKQLKGNKILIRGNHDRVSPKVARCFKKVCDYLEITEDSKRIVMSHYPMPFWNGQFRDSIHLYGHVHNSHQWNMMRSWRKEIQLLQDIPARMYNVGCMMKWVNYKPVTLKDIIADEYCSEITTNK